MVTDGPGVTVDLSNAAVMHRTGIMYPANARAGKVEGTVLVEATLDGSGNVVDARVVSGPAELRRSVLQSVLQWHFANDTGANTRQIKISFTNPPDMPSTTVGVTGTATSAGTIGGVLGGIPGGVTGGVIRTAPGQRLPFAGKTLKQINIVGLTDDARSRLGGRLPVHVGDILDEDLFMRTITAVREYDEHMTLSTKMDPDGGIGFVISAPGANASTGYAFTSNEPQANVPGRITIGGNVQSAKLTQQPRPMYPPLAKQARISGVVKLAVIINRDGTMQDIKVISGHPLLIPPTIEAVKNWVYQPTLLNGQPVEVSTQIDVNFTLSDEIPQQQQ